MARWVRRILRGLLGYGPFFRRRRFIGNCAVAISTMHLAHWFRSRERFGNLDILAALIHLEPSGRLRFDPSMRFRLRLKAVDLRLSSARQRETDIPLAVFRLDRIELSLLLRGRHLPIMGAGGQSR